MPRLPASQRPEPTGGLDYPPCADTSATFADARSAQPRDASSRSSGARNLGVTLPDVTEPVLKLPSLALDALGETRADRRDLLGLQARERRLDRDHPPAGPPAPCGAAGLEPATSCVRIAMHVADLQRYANHLLGVAHDGASSSDTSRRGGVVPRSSLGSLDSARAALAPAHHGMSGSQRWTDPTRV
jgi:hypothetical protein